MEDSRPSVFSAPKDIPNGGQNPNPAPSTGSPERSLESFYLEGTFSDIVSKSKKFLENNNERAEITNRFETQKI